MDFSKLKLPIRQTQDNPICAGLVENIDEAVGAVVSNLKNLGLNKNTIIIFSADNGGVTSGDNFSTSSLPQRWRQMISMGMRYQGTGLKTFSASTN